MKQGKLVIGVDDLGQYWALIARLLSEGHTVVTVIPTGAPVEVLGYTQHPNMIYVDSIYDLIHRVHYVIGFEHNPSYRSVCILKGIPFLGHSPEATALEMDRSLAFNITDSVLNRDGTLLHLPFQCTFDTPENLLEFLGDEKNSNIDWVLKQSVNSPSQNIMGRTVIGRACDEHSSIKRALTATPNCFWINGEGGAILEQFIEGVEISFGQMFNGEEFVGPMYHYQEHKDAQNGNRSGLLTGEVGSTMTWHNYVQTGIVHDMFSNLALLLKNLNTKGMVDINTIIDSAGNLYLIEYTVRWGRPTLEVMCGCIGVDLGNLLYSVVKGDKVPDVWSEFPYSMGVVVFEYGYPLVEGNRVNSIACIPKSTDSCQAMPMFCMPPLDLHERMTTIGLDSRLFVMTSSSDSVDECRDSISAALKDYSASKESYGLTWRDDIGYTWDTINSIVDDMGLFVEGID